MISLSIVHRDCSLMSGLITPRLCLISPRSSLIGWRGPCRSPLPAVTTRMISDASATITERRDPATVKLSQGGCLESFPGLWVFLNTANRDCQALIIYLVSDHNKAISCTVAITSSYPSLVRH